MSLPVPARHRAEEFEHHVRREQGRNLAGAIEGRRHFDDVAADDVEARQAAKAIKQLSERSPHGDANFNFGAIAMMKPYGPYYPGSYHLGKGHAFAIAMEGAELGPCSSLA